MEPWTIQDAKDLYNVAGWGREYFSINPQGNVVMEAQDRPGEIDLKQVVDDLVRRGLSLPLLIRFSDLLGDRISALCRAFDEKIEEYEYEGDYKPVMPIKVNQQRHVVEELIRYGEIHGLGLEAGSKPELLIAIALMAKTDGGLIVCNGYKDAAYIETALLSQRLGITTLLIVDRYEELPMIIDAARRLNLAPLIGVRAKLATRGSGRWAESGGDRSKFGLTASELVRCVEALAEADLLDRLVCLHFHIGSQITAIRAVKEALREAAKVYTNLHNMGAKLGYLDVGGGLAVDYDGSQTNFHASKNYTLSEYAADVVDSIASALDEADIPHPTILSESGRALVAHHAVLVFNVLGQNARAVPPQNVSPSENEHAVVRNLRETLQTVTRKNYQEAYHDAVQLKEDGLSLFRHGIIDLRARAKVEELFWATTLKIWQIVRTLEYVPDDFAGLGKLVSDTYFCNFSVFQSVPDSWAVGHLFPVMPIHRLDERPTRLGVLADLTCDSDGKINKFIDLHDVKDALELHALKPDEPYFLGIFLVGAYQEVLGDLHNLFGDVNAVHVAYDDERGYKVRHVVSGDTVKDVLSYVAYDQQAIMSQLREAIEGSLADGTMTFEESANLVRHFEACLSGYTYLEEPQLAEILLNSVIPKKNDEESDVGCESESALL